MPITHRINSGLNLPVAAPVQEPPASGDCTSIMNLATSLQRWKAVPAGHIDAASPANEFTYAYVGTKDYTMYPVIFPGSFLQVDESVSRIAAMVGGPSMNGPFIFCKPAKMDSALVLSHR